MVDSKVRINVPGRSSFDKSFKNILTTKVGVLTPIVNKLVIPGSKGSLKIAISAALPPLASDTFMRADLKVEAFLCPLRLLYGGFEPWLVGEKQYLPGTGMSPVQFPRIKVPAFTGTNTYLASGTLSDYLGVRSSSQAQNDIYFNAYPYLCYHRIWDDWYRNAKVTAPIFSRPISVSSFNNNEQRLRCMPYICSDFIIDLALSHSFPDGVSIGSLRSRNFGDDYFTIASPSAQQGTAQSVLTTGNVFTISALRASNSLQQYAERSQLGSPRLQDFVKSHYGADLSSGVAQRAILLGSASYPVYSKGVEGTTTSTATNNPFTSVGARYGNAFASGNDFVCEFEANEPAILMVMASLVPEANYSSGIKHEMTLFTQAGCQVDLPDPLLENVGNEPILDTELTGDLDDYASGTVFGYVPRNTFHKTGVNEVHGLLRSGESLASFVACRSLSGINGISTAFLQIPTNALDNVTAVTSDLSNYGCWIDSFINLKVSEPLSECAIPSLQDPAYEHGRSVVVKQNGSQI